MQDSGMLNERVAKLLIKELIHQGVRYFCIAPGSRSTPLIAAAAGHPLAETFVHFDERSLGFHALGYAKAKGVPAAVIVTSGSAGANLLPSVIEASMSHVPMIILTADRPPELLDCGANQTMIQKDLFHPFIRWDCLFPTPEPELEDKYWSSAIAQGVYRSKRNPAGPVHFNCPYRKPLDAQKPSGMVKTADSIRYSEPQLMSREEDISALADGLGPIEKGVIVVGSLPHSTSFEALESLSRLLQWPILADVTSGMRSKGQVCGSIPYYDLILKSLATRDELRVDAVLHFGGPCVSATLGEWMKNHKPEFYCQIGNNPGRQDPHRLLTHHFECDPMHFAGELTHFLPGRGPSDWISLWNNLATVVGNRVETFFAGEDKITEPAIARMLCRLPADTATFIGNSMPIRDADQLFFPQGSATRIFASRGVSGIDGNIATAAGVCHGLKAPTVAVLGDQTCLHDLTSLAQVKCLENPFVLIIINNGGGGIFSFLPIAKRKDIEAYFSAPHQMQFKLAAEQFGIEYHQPHACSELNDLIGSALEKNCPTIIEVITERAQNHALHMDLLQQLAGIPVEAVPSSNAFYAPTPS